MPLLKMNDYRSQLRKKFAKDYSAVIPGKTLPAKFSIANRELGGELRRIQDVQSGRFGAEGEESMLSKLTLVLEAFNRCASLTELNIDKISVTTKSIRIEGDTSSRGNTHKLFEAVRDKMEIEQFNYDLKGGRDSFNITVVPKK